MSHLRTADGTVLCDHDDTFAPELHLGGPVQARDEDHEHEHSHGLIDRSILRSRAGIRAVSLGLAILTLTALAQALIYSRTLSVALLADLIHNFGDALTAIPLGLIITLVILHITWESWHTVRSAEIDLEHINDHGH